VFPKISFYLAHIKRYLVNTDFRESLHSILRYKYMFDKKNKIIFYDLFSIHRQFTHSTIMELSNIQNKNIVLFIGEKRHEDYMFQNKNLNIFYVDSKHTYLFKLLSNKIFITAASHLSEKSKPKNSIMIHMFHSLVSVHYIYSENAFDAYDIFFAAGPHHITELNRTGKIRNWKNKRFLRIGYPKLDYFSEIKNTSTQELKTILFAPSWMQYNLLKLHGVEIVEKALELNYKIIVRPHPHSFTEDIDIINKIKNISEESNLCILEDSNVNGMDSFMEADIMISDWSGAAYEYAFGLLKPVLFIDVPPKMAECNFVQREFLPMENVCREKVGVVSFIDDFEVNLLKIMNDNTNWQKKIGQVRSDYVYNFGVSAIEAAKEIVKIKENIPLVNARIIS